MVNRRRHDDEFHVAGGNERRSSAGIVHDVTRWQAHDATAETRVRLTMAGEDAIEQGGQVIVFGWTRRFREAVLGAGNSDTCR
ncbi:MAG: hypothetical protein HBSAPP02_07430 [Phycisphaerae bacterium]|nr:MAG: hypothetical protein HBSAPP02_07430 [Phycisphaerae bacterium]